jgi:formylglycine-generating enzyme required for sulfatase activity
VDGPIHEGQQHEDAVRQQALENAGLRVIRFTNEEVFNNLERVLIDIQRAAVAPLSLGRGAGGEGWQIRLPTEWEWQWMAQNGAEARQYPWGDWDEHPRANTTGAGIGDRSTAVGMYPHGAADCGALDVAGNLWEWCLNDYQNPEIFNGYGNEETKVLRGGSFFNGQLSAAASFRNTYDPNLRYDYIGLRLAVCPISAL